MPGSDDKVTLVRPDGSTFNASRDDADQFQALGYQHESAQAAVDRNMETAREAYYTTPGQRTVAGLEGFVNGLTVGGYTTLFGGSPEEQDRARYNPGTRLGGEIVGAVLPSLIPGGAEAEGAGLVGRALGATPTGLLTRGAEAIAEGTTATKTGHALVRGAVEGAAFGGAAEATNAKLSGDPVTAEAIVAGMGWGALWGGGLGYLSGKIGVSAEKAAAEAAEKATVPEAAALATEHAVSPEAWSGLRMAVDDVRNTSKKAISDAVGKIEEDGALNIHASVVEHSDAIGEAQRELFNQIDAKGKWAAKGARGIRAEMIKSQRQMVKALLDKDYAGYEAATGTHLSLMKKLAFMTKMSMPEAEPFVLQAAEKAAKSSEHLQDLHAVTDAMNGLPFTSEGFHRMTATKMEKVGAAIDKFVTDAPEEFAAQKAAITKAIDGFVGDVGLSIDSASPGQKLRQAHEILRLSSTKKAAEQAEHVRMNGFGTGTLKYVGAHTARNMAKQAGGGLIARGFAGEMGHKLVGAFLNMVGGVKGVLAGAVAKSLSNPTAAKVTKLVGPKIDPLKVRLDGSLEESDLPRKKLMELRMKEIREAAPTIHDTMYRAVEPIVGHHPELAAAMSKAATTQFLSLFAKMPRDPGKAFNRLKSLWTPDPVATEKFARAYEVFQNPVGAATRWLENPHSVTPEGARAMKEFNPELWQVVRVEMLNKLAAPGAMDKLSYHEQIGLGQLLDLRIHSSQSPEFIQAQQAMFQQRNEPLPARPSASNNSNNPSGTSRDMTPAQRITEH